MDVFATIIAWVYTLLATWYVAAMIGGVLILIAERRDRRREASDDDVRHAAARYRQPYGSEAFHVIGDHMMAASFAPDGRHRAILKRVSADLLAAIVGDEDRAQIADFDRVRSRLGRAGESRDGAG